MHFIPYSSRSFPFQCATSQTPVKSELWVFSFAKSYIFAELEEKKVKNIFFNVDDLVLAHKTFI